MMKTLPIGYHETNSDYEQNEITKMLDQYRYLV